jgi:phage gp29-like protein
VPLPTFKFLTEDSVDLSAYSVAIKNLKEAGLRIPAKPVRDVAGLPEPDKGDEVLGDADPNAPTDPNADPNAPKKPDPNKPDAPAKPDPEAEEPKEPAEAA